MATQQASRMEALKNLIKTSGFTYSRAYLVGDVCWLSILRYWVCTHFLSFLKAYVCVLQIWGRTKSWVEKFYSSICFGLQEQNIHCCLSFFSFLIQKFSFGYRVWEQYVVKHGWKSEIMQILEISAIVRNHLPNYREDIGLSTSPDNFSEES